ncbi:MAG: nucleoside triphosphate pyrophosphohydrolase [Planctomycetota bacterium]
MSERQPSERPDQDLRGFAKLLAIVAQLRAPDGCPWDRKQTTSSMVPCLIEEAFEAADALRRGDDVEAQEELGDVLVNVAMICQIASEGGRFEADSLAEAAAAKLVRRHPHVFGDSQAADADSALQSWEDQKRRERAAGKAGSDRSVLAGVPVALPALLRAYRVGQKAKKAGFDWPHPDGPRAKLDEEIGELDEAIASGDRTAIQDELGDALFSLCNLARHLGVEPETALAGTIDKFQRRFRYVEQAHDYDLTGASLEEMEAAWQKAKSTEAD